VSLANVGRYETELEHFGAPEWVELSALPGLLVTREPLRCTGPEAEQGIVWARASERRAREVATSLGARLPTAAECEAIARDPRVRIISMCAQPPDHRMTSPEWARRHDACVALKLAQLEAGQMPWTIGKHWVQAPTIGKHWVQAPGRTAMFGFYLRSRDPKSIVQRGGTTMHNAAHVDYAMTVALVKQK
jgi:hypothetical protein